MNKESWKFLGSPEFWVNLSLAIVLTCLGIYLGSRYIISKVKQTATANGGSVTIQAGDGGSSGNGGNMYIGAGKIQGGQGGSINQFNPQ